MVKREEKKLLLTRRPKKPYQAIPTDHSKGYEIMNNFKEIHELEEHEHAVYMDNELKRRQRFLRKSGADKEMRR